MRRPTAALITLTCLAGAAPASAQQLELVSREAGPDGAALPGVNWDPTVSSDGRFVAFETNPDPGGIWEGRPIRTRIYLRDVRDGAVGPVDIAMNGEDPDGRSAEASISADGSRIAFMSTATNLHPDDDDAEGDVFVRDLKTQTTILVSRGDGADGEPGTGWSQRPSISADGSRVAFSSYGANLDGADQTVGHVYVRDLDDHTTELVSRHSDDDGAEFAEDSTTPVISGDGRYVAFESREPGLGQPADDVAIFRRDTEEQATELVSRATGALGAPADGHAQTPSISADGQTIAFRSGADNLSTADRAGTVDIFTRDMASARTELISRRSAEDGGAAANDSATDPSVSADGTVVTFTATATNLSTRDDDDVNDIFVRDRTTRATRLVSRQSASDGGDGADAHSSRSEVSSDGRFAVFETKATNLSADADGDEYHVYRRDLRVPPATEDGDGEIAPPLPPDPPPPPDPPAPPTPPAPPVGVLPAPSLPAPSVVQPSVRFPAKLRVRRAGVKGGRLDVLAEMTARATGKLEGTFRSGGRTHEFEVEIPEDGVVRIDEKLPSAMRRARTGIVELEYAGSALVRPDEVRLRAANGKARLRRAVSSLVGGRLRVAGTISRRARGVVRIRHDYVAADGSAASLDLRARIANGRWSIDERLTGPAARGGHLSIQFTGYEAAGMRGEQTAKQVP